MDFKSLIDFLKTLQQNNTKEWMDANRKRYQKVRNDYILWLNHINNKLAALDDGYYDTPGKKGINRINNRKL